MSLTYIGENFEAVHDYTKENIAEFAKLCGDFNPLHHDETYAKTTRFGAIIACGPQVSSQMMALTATYFSKKGAMLGLEFSLSFLKAVKAGESIHTRWEVTHIVPKTSLQGEIVSLKAVAKNQSGDSVVSIEGKVLLTEFL